MKVFLSTLRRPQRVLLAVGLAAFLLMALMPASRPVAAAPAAQQGNSGVYHIVQPGEYLAKIARQYGSTVQNIVWANPAITNWNLIYPGQVIFVPFGPVVPPPPPPPPPQPVPPPPPACRWYHVVVPGQNLFQISQIYGVNMYHIAQANGILNLNLIFAGTTLCIP